MRMISESAAILVTLALFGAFCGRADAQNVAVPSARLKQQVLSLDFKNNGQHLSAKVGQQIEITLGTIGPKQYGTPQVSSPAILLDSVALGFPLNPGGPTFVYVFEAASEGEAQIIIPINQSDDPEVTERLSFAVTIRVRPATGRQSPIYAFRTPDQVNAAAWTEGWTNLLNVVRQTFKPSLPRLTGVEVELVAANPESSSDEVTIDLLNEEGQVLAVVSKTVPVDDCDHVLFAFPNGGLNVSPGQQYAIELKGGATFGWKYVVGGYNRGAAYFNGKPLLPDARSTFLFKTFGAVVP